MSKIKVTVYDRETDGEEFRYVAHTGSFCGLGSSHSEAIGNLLIQINKHVPKDFDFNCSDLEIQQNNFAGLV